MRQFVKVFLFMTFPVWGVPVLLFLLLYDSLLEMWEIWGLFFYDMWPPKKQQEKKRDKE